MSLAISNSFESVKSRAKLISMKSDYRRVRSKEASNITKFASVAGAVVGTGCALALCAKKQKSGLFDVDFGLKEIAQVALGGILGGVTGGILSIKPNKRNYEKKVDEGIFQYSMIAVPGLAVSGAIAGCEKVKALNNAPVKIGATLLALGVGMNFAVDFANFVSDVDNDEPDRKLKFKDAIASVDDIIGICLLAKVKAVKKLKLDKLMPAIYAYCGYKAGTTT